MGSCWGEGSVSAGRLLSFCALLFEEREGTLEDYNAIMSPNSQWNRPHLVRFFGGGITRRLPDSFCFFWSLSRWPWLSRGALCCRNSQQHERHTLGFDPRVRVLRKRWRRPSREWIFVFQNKNRLSYRPPAQGPFRRGDVRVLEQWRRQGVAPGWRGRLTPIARWSRTRCCPC